MEWSGVGGGGEEEERGACKHASRGYGTHTMPEWSHGDVPMEKMPEPMSSDLNSATSPVCSSPASSE